MSRSKSNKKPGYLGPAFHHWLEYLESIEYLYQTGHTKGKRQHMALNNRLWDAGTDAEFQSMMLEILPVDAVLAKVVRSSVKYKVRFDTLTEIVSRYGPQMAKAADTFPMRLPYAWCTLVIEGFGGDDILLCLQETEVDEKEGYPALGLAYGDPFISINACMFRNTGVEMDDGVVSKAQKLSSVPVELHWQVGELLEDTKMINAMAGSVQVLEEGKRVIETIRVCAGVWIESFNLQGMLRNRVAGVVPDVGRGRVRKKYRKRAQHPTFEHEILELSVDALDPQQTGGHAIQPKKRLHQVRGFYRHYKSGKVSWVPSHWRGDEHIGVIKKDYEVTIHPEEGT